MKWLEVMIKTTEEASDAVSEMLMSIGAGGVAIEDPNDIRKQINASESLDYADDEFLNSLGEDVTIKAYFPSDTIGEGLIPLVNEKLNFISGFLEVGKRYIGMNEVDDEDWATAWKKYYKPFNISSRVVIKPSWEEYFPKEGEIIIELDPGMAFGTGTHETTRMCAQLLEKYVKSQDEILDLGCGTGILSIIAAKLGAVRVLAADIDETAVRITRENCAINKVANKVTALKGILENLEKNRSDIVVANIIADVIRNISVIVPDYLKNNGYFITSGIIKERKDEIIDSYIKSGFIMEECLEMGEWVAIVFRCQGSL
jgi:ribosomal protein L11 methyltransferase